MDESRFRLFRAVAICVAATLLLVSGAARAQITARSPLPYASSDRSVGVVNCANSLCHGSVQPFKSSNVLQTEYVTWSRVDKHARAYLVLANEQSRRIARNLGLGDPSEERLCLDCHAHNVPEARRGERLKLEDGVSCESCHGPAGRWLSAHVADNATHEGNLRSGLYDTANAVSRARLCLSCHLGNADRFVTHRMMGAGHPRMSFELDTFTVVEPSHFKVDADWEKRKKLWDGVRVWAVGQAVVVSEMVNILADPKRSHDGMFPELVLFDCHACHHPMSDKRWAPRVGSIGPGAVRLNDSSMLMARQIAKVVDPALGARIALSMEEIQQAAAGKAGDVRMVAQKLQGQMDELIVLLEAKSFAEPEMRAILTGLIDDGLAGQYRDYAGAEQATMAIGSVASFMYRRGVLKSARDVNAGLAAIQQAVSDDERYRPAQFEAALRDFRGSVGL